MKLPDPEIFKTICKNIKFWDDGSNKPYDNEYLNTFIQNAKQIYFLGFGFHEGILDRFEPNILAGKKIYCTVKDVGQKKWEEIVTFLCPGIAALEIPPLGTTEIENVRFGKENQTCDDFFMELFVE